MNHAELIEILLNAIPYPQQIKNMGFREENALRFEWRGTAYRIDSSLGADEVDGGCLVGSDKAMLMAQCLKFAQMNRNK